MYRLIYFELENEYRTFDSDEEQEVLSAMHSFEELRLNVICIVDYTKQSITLKCGDYPVHQDRIDNLIFDPKHVSHF